MQKANLWLHKFVDNLQAMEKWLSSLEGSQNLQMISSSYWEVVVADVLKMQLKIPSKVLVQCYE